MVLQARSLRIGNLVLESNTEGAVTFLGCESNDVDFICEILSPIPLTEEWLVRLGFKIGEFKHTNHRYNYNDLCISKNLNTFNWSFYDCFADEVNDYGEVKHVHQLQNLYFALTGEELEIK